ncbi:MAG: heme-binding domain-containing protein [Calditrichia bacterium]
MKKLIIVLLILFPFTGLIIPRTNPPVSGSVKWDSPKTEQYFKRACANCHSHETDWPWYSYLAPAAFLVAHNVNEAREHFNISTSQMGEADEAYEVVLKKEMPPSDYLLLHPEAKLSPEEIAEFSEGLKKTFSSDPKKFDSQEPEE